MDNWHKILGSIALGALIYIVFLQGCGSHKCPESEIVEIIKRDSITHIDTNYFDTTIVKYLTVRVPIPYYDTIYESIYKVEDFDDFTEYAQIYEDTVSDDTISINYRIKVWGFIDKMEIGYKVFTPFSIVKTTTIETEVVKKKRFNGIYFGMDVGIGKDGLTHVAPMLELSTAKINYNGGFDFNDKSVMFGARFKIGK